MYKSYPQNGYLNNNDGLVMTSAEKDKCTILIVDSNQSERESLRSCLRNSGYNSVSEAPSHAAALEKLQTRRFSHIIFEAKRTNMPPREFIQTVFRGDDKVICIAASHDPQVDDVFELMILGARGYLVKPYTLENVEQSIAFATKGEPISDAIINAKDRNEALISIVMASLDKTSSLLRQAAKFETAKRELPKSMGAFRRAVDLAKTFAKGGEDELLAVLERMCLERSQGPATKLGRLRKRLHVNRIAEDSPQPSR